MAIRKRTWATAGKGEQTRWVVDYRDQSGQRRLRTFTTKKAADQWMVQARHEISTGVHTPASVSGTVTDAIEQWLAHGEGEWEYGTTRQRRQHLRYHIEPFIGGIRLAELTLPRVNQFVLELRDGGRSPVMRQKVLTTLKTALGYAQNIGLVAQNVARAARAKASSREVPTGPLREGVDFPGKAELARLIEHTPEQARAFILTLVFTGMRISEIRGLQWQDVDLKAGVIHVRRRADAWGRIAAPKSHAGARDIPLPPLVLNALCQHRPNIVPPTSLVFGNARGRVQTRQNLQKRLLARIQVAAGVVDARRKVKYGFHAFRHAAASLFIAHLNWSPKRVQTVMGHANIGMTFDRYGHLFEDPEADRDAMAKLETALRVV